MDYLQGLNPEQRAAVEQTEGPVMIIAGAGSGKTRVITYRVAHLIRKGVDSFNILVLTFTNKAAREMRERITHVVGGEAKNIWMGTFHSVFAKLLRVEADKIGYPNNFTIYDTDDSKSVLRAILKEMNLDDKLYNVNFVLNRISASKNNLISWQEYNKNEQIQADDMSSTELCVIVTEPLKMSNSGRLRSSVWFRETVTAPDSAAPSRSIRASESVALMARVPTCGAPKMTSGALRAVMTPSFTINVVVAANPSVILTTPCPTSSPSALISSRPFPDSSIT